MWFLLLSSLGALCVAENLCTNRGENKGEDCDKCDTMNHYFRDPINDGCFYRLSMDYQFNFDLSKPADKHYSAINFEIVPTKPNLDVDFFISSSVNASMNMTYRQNSKEGKKGNIILMQQTRSNFTYRLSKVLCPEDPHYFSSYCIYFQDDFTFGKKENTTFYVYLYNFKPPLFINISFAQVAA